MQFPSFFRNLGRFSGRALILASPLLLAGCDFNFWRMDGRQTTMVVDGPVAHSQLQVFYVTCWVTAVIFVLVGGVLAYATFKFKAKSEADEHAEPPPQGHGNPLIELGLIAASVFALVIIAIPTLKAIWYTYDIPEAEKANAYEITATGYQWWFRFDYPKEQIEGGTLIAANELVIPAGRPVRVNLRTTDVIHSFWVPKLAGKVDMIPNRGNHLWLQADKPGYFWGQCAEYCGDSHAVMRFRVIALSEKDFANWLVAQKATARKVDPATNPARPQFAAFKQFKKNEAGYTDKYDVAPLDQWQQFQFPPRAEQENAELIAEGHRLFEAKTCNTCHTIREPGKGGGVNGPDLTHVGARTTIAAGLLENNPDQLARWLRHPNEVKPGTKMYYGIGGMAGYVKPDGKGGWTPNIQLNETEITALVAYLSSLK